MSYIRQNGLIRIDYEDGSKGDTFRVLLINTATDRLWLLKVETQDGMRLPYHRAADPFPIKKLELMISERRAAFVEENVPAV